MSAFVKIPLQLLVLSTGVLVFIFYLFQAPPMLFNRAYDAQVAAGPHAAEYQRAPAAVRPARSPLPAGGGRARRPRRVPRRATRVVRRHPRRAPSTIVKETTGDTRYTDVNYVFPTFITTRMPIGLVGLMIAAIFAAAMSASARRAERAGDGDDHRLLPAALREGRDRRALPAPSRSSRRSAGDCSPAWSRCTRRTRDRSSRW